MRKHSQPFPILDSTCYKLYNKVESGIGLHDFNFQLMLTDQPHLNLAEGLSLESFLSRTSEQCRRFQELKTYPSRLMAVKNKLADKGVETKFFNRTSLLIDIFDPADSSRKLHALIQQFDPIPDHLWIYTPYLSYSFLIEALTAEMFVQRMKKGGLI